jgi:hypothetical protein
MDGGGGVVCFVFPPQHKARWSIEDIKHGLISIFSLQVKTGLASLKLSARSQSVPADTFSIHECTLDKVLTVKMIRHLMDSQTQLSI